MIKLKNKYNAYSTLGLNRYEYRKVISGLGINPKSRPQYFPMAKIHNKTKKRAYNFSVLKEKFIISETINTHIFNGVKNISFHFAGDGEIGEDKNLPKINGKPCINSLLDFEGMGGDYFTKGDDRYNNLFKAEIPSPTETYYWYNSGGAREGIRIKNPNNYNMTNVYVYGSSDYPLYDCYLEAMNDDGTECIEKLYHQDMVSNEGNPSYKPMYYNGFYNGKILDFVRYIHNSNNCLTRILVLGNTYVRKILLEKDGKYYNISDNMYNSETKSYNALEITDLNEDIFNENSFHINELLKEKTIQDENFVPLDKFNGFKIVVLTQLDEELQRVGEIELHIDGKDIPFSKRENQYIGILPTHTDKLLQEVTYYISSDSFVCNFVNREKLILQPNVRTNIVIRAISEKEDDDGKLKGDIKGFTFICQKGHFVELNLDFVEEDIKIDFVSNLPDGLIFENGKIKGTPLKSGKTQLEIHTTKKQVLHCNIEVPPLIRLL